MAPDRSTYIDWNISFFFKQKIKSSISNEFSIISMVSIRSINFSYLMSNLKWLKHWCCDSICKYYYIFFRTLSDLCGGRKKVRYKNLSSRTFNGEKKVYSSQQHKRSISPKTASNFLLLLWHLKHHKYLQSFIFPFYADVFVQFVKTWIMLHNRDC